MTFTSKQRFARIQEDGRLARPRDPPESGAEPQSPAATADDVDMAVDSDARITTLVEHFEGSYYLKRENIDCDSKTDAELLAVADRMVQTTDAVKEAFAACCTMPVVVRLHGSKYTEWFGACRLRAMLLAR